MKETMRHEMAIMSRKRDARRFGLAGHRFIGERDVAEHRRRAIDSSLRRGKRKHIGRLVYAAPTGVEFTYARIVAEAKADGGPVVQAYPDLVDAGGDRLTGNGPRSRQVAPKRRRNANLACQLHLAEVDCPSCPARP